MTSPGRSIAETFDVGFVGWVPPWLAKVEETGLVSGHASWHYRLGYRFLANNEQFLHQPEVTGPRRLRFSNDEGKP